MGYLDHSTNNIILDAVLTDYGRQRLSAGGAFNIASYSLGDDEVDYRIVKKYGRTVGKEKIEKNTPIFEALTNPSIALKYKLIGRENDGSFVTTAYLPVLKTVSTPQLTATSGPVSVKIDLYYNNLTGASVPSEFLQTLYQIKVSDRFFALSTDNNGNLSAPSKASSLISAGDPNRIAVYEFNTNGLTTPTTITFNVQARSIDSTTLSIYGKRTGSGNERQINSYITITGMRHGCTLDIPISYKANL